MTYRTKNKDFVMLVAIPLNEIDVVGFRNVRIAGHGGYDGIKFWGSKDKIIKRRRSRMTDDGQGTNIEIFCAKTKKIVEKPFSIIRAYTRM